MSWKKGGGKEGKIKCRLINGHDVTSGCFLQGQLAHIFFAQKIRAPSTSKRCPRPYSGTPRKGKKKKKITKNYSAIKPKGSIRRCKIEPLHCTSFNVSPFISAQRPTVQPQAVDILLQGYPSMIFLMVQLARSGLSRERSSGKKISAVPTRCGDLWSPFSPKPLYTSG